MWSKLLVAVTLLVGAVNADIYMQFPRGSNNRLSEANRERTNANRMFDSQNNNRGGYNVGNVYFYTGTTMNIEWTNQHSCGGPNNHCEMIIQYTCDSLIRDGSTTNTIPTTAGSDGNPAFGRHESLASYNNCKWRSRNKGLFIANRNIQNNGRNGAIYTRQNENGQRYGYECAEERDYYPYWHPTMWRDIAILTNTPSRCPQYQALSQNVAERWYCNAPDDWVQYQAALNNGNNNGFIPVNATECSRIRSRTQYDSNNNTVAAQWTYVAPWGIPAPDCVGTRFTRDNHLGNIASGNNPTYNWTVPDSLISERCVLRIRYNISTGDYADFSDFSNVDAPANLTNLNNSRPTNNAARDPANIDVWSKYGLSWSEVNVSVNPTTNDPNGATIKKSRDYVFKDNPKVDIFGNALIPKTQSGDPNAPAMIRLQLAISTDQFGRTFQDRSHRFAIRQLPSQYQGSVVHNVQVRGRRGNIVQVYPGTEYDFTPKRLIVQNGEYVHFQWTGSNANEDNGNDNAGRGRRGTDRHNVLLLRAPVYDYVQRAQEYQDSINAVPTVGALGSTYPTRIDGSNSTFLGFGYSDLKALATFNTDNVGGDLDQGDDAPAYFDLGPRQATTNGIFNYACSRNNDFSNRDQKATIIVGAQSYKSASFSAGVASTLTAASGAVLAVDSDALRTGTYTFTLLTAPSNSDSSFSGTVNSDYVTLMSDYNDPTDPFALPLVDGKAIRLTVPYQKKALVIPQLYRADSMTGEWSTVGGASYSGGDASADVTRGGVYVVQTQVNWGGVVGIIVGCVAFVGIVVGGLYYHQKKQNAGVDTKLGSKA